MNPVEWLRDTAYDYARDAQSLRENGMPGDAPVLEAVASHLRECADRLEAEL